MAVADWNFTAGHYTCSWNGTDIGSSKEGFNLRIEYHEQMIITDEFGEGAVDGVIIGMDVFVDLDFVEYAEVEDAIMAQAGANTAAQGYNYTEVGKLLTAKAAELILVPVLRTANTRTYTANKAIIVGNINAILSSRLREGPITFRLFPQTTTAGGNRGKYFVMS